MHLLVSTFLLGWSLAALFDGGSSISELDAADAFRRLEKMGPSDLGASPEEEVLREHNRERAASDKQESHVRNGDVEVLNPSKESGGEKASEQQKAGSKIVLNLEFDGFEYFVYAHFGSDMQKLPLLVDTLSKDIWVSKSGVPIRNGDESRASRSGLNSSTTFVYRSRPYRRSLHFGKVEGNLASNILKMGAVQVSGSQAFGLIETADIGVYSLRKIDGVLGLSQSKKTSDDVFPSFIQNIRSLPQITSKVFSVDLKRTSEVSPCFMGTLTIGAEIPAGKQPIATVKTFDGSSWVFPMKKVSFGKALLCDSRCRTVPFPGWQGIGFSKKSFPVVTSEIDRHMELPWSESAAKPLKFTFTINEKNFEIDHRELTGKLSTEIPMKKRLIFEHDLGDDLIVLGDVFFAKYHTFFDFKNARIQLFKY